MSPHRIVGQGLFVDGITRPVYADDAGQQFIVEDGQRIDGLFFVPAEEEADAPLIVHRGDH